MSCEKDHPWDNFGHTVLDEWGTPEAAFNFADEGAKGFLLRNDMERLLERIGYQCQDAGHFHRYVGQGKERIALKEFETYFFPYLDETYGDDFVVDEKTNGWKKKSCEKDPEQPLEKHMEDEEMPTQDVAETVAVAEAASLQDPREQIQEAAAAQNQVCLHNSANSPHLTGLMVFSPSTSSRTTSRSKRCLEEQRMLPGCPSEKRG